MKLNYPWSYKAARYKLSFSLSHSLNGTKMYIPDHSPQNIILFFAAIMGVSIVVGRELKPSTRLGYSKFASKNAMWKARESMT